jgi:thymidylate synthase
MKTYLDALQFVLDNGVTKTDRTGTGTISVFGMQQRYDLSKGFPAVTTKKLAWKSVVSELLWFIEGTGDET